MKHQAVYFIFPPRTLLLDVAGPAEALAMANRNQNDVRFDMHYCAARIPIESSIGLLLSNLTPLPESPARDAMIVVAGSKDGPEDAGYKKSRELIVDWLRRSARPTHRLVFICSGALLAAKAGLLDQRSCTTHHSHCSELRHLAASAKVLENRIYVPDGNVYTSAGVTAGIDLMLHLISEIAGPLCAVAVARDMVVYLRRSGADPQLSPWLEGRNHIHPAVHRVQDAIAANPAHHWTIGELSTLAYSSPRHLARLFHSHTRETPVAYINRLRVELARQLLANTALPIDHVAERAGFGSSRNLRRIWRKYSTAAPGIWRRSHTDN
ncbi:helix-turn-helix domain-containing protein [bacterium]|nr:helix-turn-helix domain-containing protein [bacterium]MCI0601747.1 helix-turn-helix domain-containing protein [bacterium]